MTFNAFHADIGLTWEIGTLGNKIMSMLFSLSCGVHAVSTSDKFWTQKSNTGFTQNNMLRKFISQFEGEAVDPADERTVDNCEGIICNSFCQKKDKI